MSSNSKSPFCVAPFATAHSKATFNNPSRPTPPFRHLPQKISTETTRTSFRHTRPTSTKSSSLATLAQQQKNETEGTRKNCHVFRACPVARAKFLRRGRCWVIMRDVSGRETLKRQPWRVVLNRRNDEKGLTVRGKEWTVVALQTPLGDACG